MIVDKFIMFLIGAIVALFTSILVEYEDRKIAVSTRSLIEECQKDIPRDQYCKLLAVQEEEK